MKFPTSLLLSILLLIGTARAQAVLVSENYFPADLEFAELQKIISKVAFEDPTRLKTIDHGRLFSDVGFTRYERRVYSSGNSGSLSVEIVTLRDFRATYSLLTLLRNSNLQIGPPGDAFSASPNDILFVKGKRWIRIQGSGIPLDLSTRVANSISNRMGQDKPGVPVLISRLPKLGYDASSLRYFPGTTSYKSYRGTLPDYLQFSSDMEITQARYSLENQTGLLSLVNFPTIQIAEECFAELSSPKWTEKSKNTIYAKRAGPVLAILEGAWDSRSADKILGGIKYSYSIRWVYDKSNKSKIVWGIPTVFLRTIVNSLFFVMLLGGVSIVLGGGFAFFRFALLIHASHHSSDPSEQSEVTQLRLQ
jgi:hypothetical protein